MGQRLSITFELILPFIFASGRLPGFSNLIQILGTGEALIMDDVHLKSSTLTASAVFTRFTHRRLSDLMQNVQQERNYIRCILQKSVSPLSCFLSISFPPSLSVCLSVYLSVEEFISLWNEH